MKNSSILKITSVVLLLILPLASAWSKDSKKEFDDSNMIGYDEEHNDYFSPEEILLHPMIDIKENAPLTLTENEICSRLIKVIKSKTFNKIKVSCVNNYSPNVTTDKNLYIQIRINEQEDSSLSTPVRMYSAILMSEHKAFGSNASKRYSLLEGINYRFFFYKGEKTKDEIEKAIDEMVLGFI